MSAPGIDLIENSDRRQHFVDVRHVRVRWEPYKPDGRRQMKAKGRWQEQVYSGDFWRWQNCERPDFAHDPDPMQDERVKALVEAIEEHATHTLNGEPAGAAMRKVFAALAALRDMPPALKRKRSKPLALCACPRCGCIPKRRRAFTR
jgi:hypothetical protein